jgi:hypothetical protein
LGRIAAIVRCMTEGPEVFRVHPEAEQPLVEILDDQPVPIDTYAGRVDIDWDPHAPVTPLGQMPFFISFLKSAGLFDNWVTACPLNYTSPKAPSRRDVLGTVLLSILSGHRRYAHITALRTDTVNPPLLGMRKVLSEDAVRRAFEKIEAESGIEWLQEQLDYTVRPLLGEPWILDADTTVKPLYGEQEGAVVGYNPGKPGPTVAHLPQLHGGKSPIDAGCRGATRQPAHIEAFGGRLMGFARPAWSGPPAGFVA